MRVRVRPINDRPGCTGTDWTVSEDRIRDFDALSDRLKDCSVTAATSGDGTAIADGGRRITDCRTLYITDGVDVADGDVVKFTDYYRGDVV